MKSAITVIALALLIAAAAMLGCSDDGGNGPVPPNTDIVWVEKVSANTSDPYARVTVGFTNLDPLSGVAIPLHVSGSGFTIDSISFIGSRVADAAVLESLIDGLEQTVVMVALVDTRLIGRGTGTFAHLYFTLDEESRGQTLIIDTTTIRTESLVYVDSTGQVEIYPEFQRGEISVLF